MAERTYDLSMEGLAERNFISKIYMWIVVALLITGVVSFYMINSGAIFRLSSPMFWGVVIFELALVFLIGSKTRKMSGAMTTGMFLLYSGLNGITLSGIFLMYTRASITNVFFITACTFAAMSFYGYTTKKDLTSIGNIAFMGLIGIIFASVVNIFMKSNLVYWVISYAGVLLFVGLTAYDTQKFKNLARQIDLESEQANKMAILGALELYLDFINLFIFLLRIMGKRR